MVANGSNTTNVHWGLNRELWFLRSFQFLDHNFLHSFEYELHWRCEQTKIYVFKLLFVINFHWKLKNTLEFHANEKTIINGHTWKTGHRYFLSWPGSKMSEAHIATNWQGVWASFVVVVVFLCWFCSIQVALLCVIHTARTAVYCERRTSTS